MTLDEALLAFYRLTERFEGLPPTVQEFSDELGFSGRGAAMLWFRKLRDEGLIYTPAPLLTEGFPRLSRTHQLSKAGRQRAYLLTEAVA